MRDESQQIVDRVDYVTGGGLAHGGAAAYARFGPERRVDPASGRRLFTGRTVPLGPALARFAARTTPIGLGASAVSAYVGYTEGKRLDAINAEIDRRRAARHERELQEMKNSLPGFDLGPETAPRPRRDPRRTSSSWEEASAGFGGRDLDLAAFAAASGVRTRLGARGLRRAQFIE